MNAQEAVRIGISVYRANPDASGSQLRAQLLNAGLAADVAGEVEAFLPLAFGRRVLHGATFSDLYIDGNNPSASYPLAAQPVFTAAVRAAAAADRDTLLAIGLRSAEVRVVNDGLHARPGAQIPEFTLGSPVVSV